MEFKDYYQTLGINENASQDEIKRAYRKLARKFHPDVSKEDNAEESFKEVSEAYEALKDEEQRAAYDQLRQYGYHAGDNFQRPPDWQDHYNTNEQSHQPYNTEDIANFSDFFRSVFSESFDPGNAKSPHGFSRQQYPSKDRHAKISISLEEAFVGSKQRVSYEIPQTNAMDQVHMEQKILDITIPAGVTHGQHLRLQGLGDPSADGTLGNLYIEISIVTHKHYVLEGRDISINLPLSPWEAALGSSVLVPTLAGTVSLNIPAGTQHGKKFRLKGRGLPGTPAGDQYAVVQLLNPVKLDPESKRLYEQLASTSRFNPRASLEV